MSNSWCRARQLTHAAWEENMPVGTSPQMQWKKAFNRLSQRHKCHAQTRLHLKNFYNLESHACKALASAKHLYKRVCLLPIRDQILTSVCPHGSYTAGVGRCADASFSRKTSTASFSRDSNLLLGP